MNLKYKLMILVAGILALTSSLLTALGMAELFQGLFIIFLIIDLGRFLVLNFVVDEWKNLRFIKWVITLILSLLFVYSAIGVYNKLNSMIPDTIQTAMIEAASYNRAQDNAIIKQDRSSNLADIAQSEYQKSMDWNTKDYENCMARANGNADAENKCNNTKRRLDNNASRALKEAMKVADADLDKTQIAVDKNVKNQGEIAGVLTTVCRILPNTDCKTYDGLQTALTVIILLVICGLDYLQLSIVLAVNTRKNKSNTEELIKVIPKPKIKVVAKKEKSKKKKIVKKKQKVIKKQTVTLVPSIEGPKEIIIQTPTPIQKSVKKEEKVVQKIPTKRKKPFTHETDFYK